MGRKSRAKRLLQTACQPKNTLADSICPPESPKARSFGNRPIATRRGRGRRQRGPAILGRLGNRAGFSPPRWGGRGLFIFFATRAVNQANFKGGAPGVGTMANGLTLCVQQMLARLAGCGSVSRPGKARIVVWKATTQNHFLQSEVSTSVTPLSSSYRIFLS